MPLVGAAPVLAAVLLAATVTDLRARRVPAWLTLGAIGGGTVAAALTGADALRSSVAGLVVGGALLLPFVLRGGFGAADALLLAVIGAWLGWEFALRTAWWAALVGAALALAARCGGQRTFPYVPAIALGALLAMIGPWS
jgi:prepilin peptidase CpaA